MTVIYDGHALSHCILSKLVRTLILIFSLCTGGNWDFKKCKLVPQDHTSWRDIHLAGTDLELNPGCICFSQLFINYWLAMTASFLRGLESWRIKGESSRRRLDLSWASKNKCLPKQKWRRHCRWKAETEQRNWSTMEECMLPSLARENWKKLDTKAESWKIDPPSSG